MGYYSSQSNIGGNDNQSIGHAALAGNTNGNSNIAIGTYAGRYIGSSGTTVNSATNNSIYIGSGTRASANSQTNQIVIGYDTIGNGSNTVTLGNDYILDNVFHGIVTVEGTSGLSGVSPVRIIGNGPPSSPQNGDIWVSNGHIYFRTNGVTKSASNI